MADNVNLTADETDWLYDISAEEARAYHEILRRHQDLPEGVSSVGLRFGQDWMGEPAVWIVLKAWDDVNPSDAKIAALQGFIDKIQEDIFALRFKHWPYSTIEAE